MKIIVISEALKDIFVAKYDMDPQLIHVAHDGADIPDRNEADYVFPGGKLDAFKVGYTGHLYKGRGIELIAELAGRLPNIDFHIAGGNEDDLQYWRSTVKLPNLFFHGFISPEKIDLWRAQCDILLAPYQMGLKTAGEGSDTSSFMSPLKIFEYMAARKPIIASDLPVLREILSESNAFLVTSGDPQSWYEAILYLRENSKVREDLALQAHNDLCNKFTWQRRADNLIKLYNV